MDIKRYIIIQAVKTRENELIPIWDDRIVFEKSKMYGNIIKLKGGYTSEIVTECIYDLKTRKVEVGIELDHYPDPKFKINEIILFEKSHRGLKEDKISKIVYEKYDMVISRGRKLDDWIKGSFKDIEIDNDALYALKQWKPFYILGDGTKVDLPDPGSIPDHT